MGKLRVKHCLVNLTTRQYGSHPTSDLLGVDYFVTVPADTEFPRTLGRLELFVRFLADGEISGRVRVTVSHLNPDGSDRQIVYQKLFDMPTATGSGLLVFDRSFKMFGVRIPAEGTYAVRVTRRRRRRRWEATASWRVIGEDQIYVQRAP